MAIRKVSPTAYQRICLVQPSSDMIALMVCIFANRAWQVCTNPPYVDTVSLCTFLHVTIGHICNLMRAVSPSQAGLQILSATPKKCTSGWVVFSGKTHRELFSEFYEDLLHEPLEAALAMQPRPPASVLLFQQMMRDITTAGGVGLDPIGQVQLSC